MAVASLKTRTLHVLDIDLENRPLSYLGSDYTTDEITAIAWSWSDSEKVWCWLLDAEGFFSDEQGRRVTPESLLGHIKMIMSFADVITGHYIRKHDLPVLNGSMLDFGLAPLGQLMTQDTKLDLVSSKGMSLSQENLAAALNLPAPKIHMSQVDWRKANRLTPEGLALTRERVVGDVVQHKQLRAALVKQGMLKAPQLWEP